MVAVKRECLPIRGETLGELQRLSFDFKQGGAVKRYWLLDAKARRKHD